MEQQLDVAIPHGDRETASLRGWSRAQALALRDVSAAGAGVHRKVAGIGLLKQQMKHLDVLRARLSRMVKQAHATRTRLARSPSAPLAQGLASSTDAPAGPAATFSWPADLRKEAEGAQRPTARSGLTETFLYVPLGESEQAAQLRAEHEHAAHIVPADQSTRLWDFPDIKKWQVET